MGASLAASRRCRCAPCISPCRPSGRPATATSGPSTIRRSVFLGDLTQVHVDWGGRELIVRQTGMQPWSEGQPAFLSVAPEHCVLLEEA